MGYCDQLFKVLECYYNLNKLTLNSDKTTFMIICKASLRTPTLHIKLNTTNFVIEQAKKVKILETYFSPGLCNIINVNSIISKVNYRLNIIRKVTKYTNFRTSKIIITSIILNVFKYAAPLMINTDVRSLQKINTLLLKCTRPILGFDSYKWSTNKIMSKINWSTYYHILIYESIMLIHKSVFEGTPQTIMDLITFSLNRTKNIRSIRKPLMKEQTNSSKLQQTVMFKSVYLYNLFPGQLRTYIPKKLKKHLKEFIYQYFPNNNIYLTPCKAHLECE